MPSLFSVCEGKYLALDLNSSIFMSRDNVAKYKANIYTLCLSFFLMRGENMLVVTRTDNFRLSFVWSCGQYDEKV